MKKGDRVVLQYSERLRCVATVLGFGDGTILVRWEEGPLAGKPARVPRPGGKYARPTG